VWCAVRGDAATGCKESSALRAFFLVYVSVCVLACHRQRVCARLHARECLMRRLWLTCLERGDLVDAVLIALEREAQAAMLPDQESRIKFLSSSRKPNQVLVFIKKAEPRACRSISTCIKARFPTLISSVFLFTRLGKKSWKL
jgi:hypothetical protein